MAYKIQVGAAKLGGTSIYEGSITSEDNSVSGSVLSGSDDILVRGSLVADAAFEASNGAAITAAATASVTRTAEWVRIDSDAGGEGRLVIKRDNSGANTQLASFHANAAGTQGSFELSSTASAVVKVSCVGGTLSGSNELQLGGNLTLSNNGDLTVNGNLVIQGDDAEVNVGEFKTTDKIVLIKPTGNGDGFGLSFGLTGSNGSGAQISLETSGENRFDILDGNTGYIALSASVFYGNGGELSGLASQNSSLSVTSKVSLATASLGFNQITVNSNPQELRLLTGSSLQGGDEIIIKRLDNTTNTLEIKPNGSDLIDGETSIILESGRAAVSFVYNNSGSFMIF